MPELFEVKYILHLEPYSVSGLKEIIDMGHYDGRTDQATKMFSKEDYILSEPEDISLVEFADRMSFEDILIWCRSRDYRPILPKHLLAIAVQHRKTIFPAPIMCLGTVCDYHVLYFYNSQGWRFLDVSPVNIRWDKSCMFGFAFKP